ncbi:lipopolysaccharide biosynthesis protein [Secundilactobacillus mixtipabuli]|uniref:Exopolysaccharide protein Wzx n=1 Tax=Secundilactobacillus mixtipabuli TaxID=1435342 RepID=A0A1Z5ICH2_9LACO|nr:oligosaccharide flippase family protein [Secundilactobacillus mixtipabuli]GAW99210.1 exopolysaccharide protein Wzx [Secundilactobacillus mixtipabuli]
MNRSKKLISNSIIFTVGNLGSKFISFFMVPLYTYFMSTTQFGQVDLVITTVNLFLPVVSLSMFDAVFRFVMDKNEDSSQTLTSGICVTIMISLLLFCFYPLLRLMHISFLAYFVLILVITSLFTLIQNFARGNGNSVVYAVAGIIDAISFATLNVLFLVFLHLNVQGYLLSYLIAMFISLIYVSFSIKIWNYFSLTSFSLSLVKRMLCYSLPLIPNSLAWWLTNDANRYIILTFVGMGGNGLYAVANKIPTILNMLFNVFTQAWQISAVDEFRSQDSEEYYSSIFNKLQGLLFLLVGVFIIIIKPFMKIFVSSLYYGAWKYVPLLLLMSVFSNMSAFLGTTYLAAKKTNGIFSTTIVGMLVNLIVSLLVTMKLEIYGTCIGGTLGFLAVIVMRLIDLRKILRIKMNYTTFLVSVVGWAFMYLGLFLPFTLNYILEIFGLGLIVIINKKVVLSLVTNIKISLNYITRKFL